MAAPTCIITTVKQFTYRGNPAEEFSNRYMFSGSTPSGPTVWHDLFEELAALERTVMDSAVTVTRAYGHISPDPHAVSVWSETLNTPLAGLLTPTNGIRCPGDDAVYISFSTDRRNSKGKPVYLRKYFHSAFRQDTGADAINTAQKTAMDAMGAVLVSGLTLSARHLVDPLGNAVTGHKTGPYVTTRTLKRRGRRP